MPVTKQMTVSGPNEYVLGMVNEIIRAACSGEGSYCMGMICALAWSKKLQPNRAVLDSASKCTTIEEAVNLWYEWEKLQKGASERDELFETALRIAVEVRGASTSVLQRRLRIGYSRALAICESMERGGYVAVAQGSRPRPILGKAREQIKQWDADAAKRV